VGLTAAMLVGWLALGLTPQDDKALSQAIKKFQHDFSRPGAGDDEKINAIQYLAQIHHDQVVKAFSPLLTSDSLAVRMMVARTLSQFAGVAEAPKELLGALQSTANAGRKWSAVRIEILRGLGVLAYKPAAAEIGKLIGDREVWVAKAAIDACSRIRFEEAVPLLIKALARIEGKEGDAELSVNPLNDLVEGIGVRSLFKPDERQTKKPNERELLKEPLQGALKAITNQSFLTSKDWDRWWMKNRLSFKVAP
jgi:hypothetical protein